MVVFPERPGKRAAWRLQSMCGRLLAVFHTLPALISGGPWTFRDLAQEFHCDRSLSDLSELTWVMLEEKAPNAEKDSTEGKNPRPGFAALRPPLQRAANLQSKRKVRSAGPPAVLRSGTLLTCAASCYTGVWQEHVVCVRHRAGLWGCGGESSAVPEAPGFSVRAKATQMLRAATWLSSLMPS